MEEHLGQNLAGLRVAINHQYFPIQIAYMAAKDLELILSRQWADCLSIPIFITDARGNLLFYNEPAEEILGKKFDETGPMPVEVWSLIFSPHTEDGKPLEPEQLPLVQTLQFQKPCQGTFWITNLKERQFHLSVSSVPIIGRAGKFLGAIAIFWEKKTV